MIDKHPNTNNVESYLSSSREQDFFDTIKYFKEPYFIYVLTVIGVLSLMVKGSIHSFTLLPIFVLLLLAIMLDVKLNKALKFSRVKVREDQANLNFVMKVLKELGETNIKVSEERLYNEINLITVRSMKGNSPSAREFVFYERQVYFRMKCVELINASQFRQLLRVYELRSQLESKATP